LWFSGSFLLRFDARAFLGLLFQEPPHSVAAAPPLKTALETCGTSAKGEKGKEEN